MKRLFVLLLTLCCVTVSAASALQDTAGALFRQANDAYLKGRYRQAANLYLQVAHNAGVSAELLGSLADSYAAAGQTGLAVLNYERALRLAPSNAVLRADLQQLRKETGLFQKQTLPERLAGLLGADQWLLLSGTAFVLLSLTVLAVGLLGRKRFPQAGRLSLLFLIITLLPLPPALFRYQAWQDGVVISSNTELLISPFAEAEPVSKLKEGGLVRPLFKKDGQLNEHGQYVLVRAASGQQGWLDKSSFQQIAALPL
jgi:tetratricopeptide (TPR) repeat protein